MANQTTSKRVPISLKPELYDIFSDLSELQGKPMSRVIVELLEGVKPVLESNRDALKAVKEGSDPSQVLLNMFANGMQEMGEFSKELKSALKK